MKGDRLGEFEEFTLLAVRALGDHTYAVPVQQLRRRGHRPAASRWAPIYAALARLEDKGFVQSSMGEATAQRGGKPKRLLRVTPLGLADGPRTAPRPRRIWNAIAGDGHS